MRCVLAVDAGGSKCDALLVDEDGSLLGSGHVNVTDPDSGRGFSGSGRSGRTRTQAIRKALGEYDIDELWVIGGSVNIPEHSIDPRRIKCLRLLTCGEITPGFVLTGEEFGIVVLAGTGALVAGYLGQDKYIHLDGLGPILGDFGGGYYIGMQALRAAAKVGWHPRHQTSLGTAIPQALEITKDKRDSYVGKLVRFVNFEQHDRGEIARLAQVVDEQARLGDHIAQQILIEAATTSAETVWDVADRLAILNESYPLIGMGSIAVKSDVYWNALCARVAEFAPKFRFLRTDLPPVVGMAIIALQQMNGEENVPRDKVLQQARELYSGQSNSNMTEAVLS